MNRIKDILEQKGIIQIGLAEQAGKNYNKVNANAQNTRQPGIETLFEIAKFLNVKVTE